MNPANTAPSSSDPEIDQSRQRAPSSQSRTSRRALRIAAIRARNARRGAGKIARDGIGTATGAVGEISSETGQFVADAIIGVAKGTTDLIAHTTPAISRAVIRAIKNTRDAQTNAVDIGKEAVEEAIITAASIGVGGKEAASAATDGAVTAVIEMGGDLRDATHASISGVVSGVTRTEGDVVAATKDTAYALVSHDLVSNRDVDEMENVAVNVVDAAIIEADKEQDANHQLVTAAAAGAVEAAYRVGSDQGDQVRESVINRIARRGLAITPHLERELAELGETVSREMPTIPAAWRGKALYQAARQLLDMGGIDLAASLGFFTVLSLLPLVTLIITTLIAIGSVEGALDVLAEALDYLFPASHELIDQAIANLLGGSFTIGFIALVGLIIGANGLFAAANRATNSVFGLAQSKVIQVTITNVSIVTVLVILFLASIGFTSVIQVLLRFSQDLSTNAGNLSIAATIIFGTLSTIIPPIFTAIIFAIVYFRLPNTRVEWRDATFGAIIAIFLFEIAKHLFFWFNNLASYRTHIYGSITSVVVLMLWAYIASLIFLYGAALAKVASDLRPR